MSVRNEFPVEFEDSIEKVVAELEFDSSIPENEQSHNEKAVSNLDEQTKLEVLRYYNAILDKRERMRKMVDDYDMV